MALSSVRIALSAFLCVIIIGLWLPAKAATISGQVEIYKKGGKRLLKSYEHAVVYLSGASKSMSPVMVENIQHNKQFTPRVLAVTRGQVVRFINQDNLLHNVFSNTAGNQFDLGRYPKGGYKDVLFDTAGRVKVYCNIHKAMILDVLVLDNPYAAVTDAHGNYSIAEVPAGDYTLHAWHVYGGETSQPLKVQGNNQQVPTLKLVSTKIVRDLENHKNKFGKRYRKRNDDDADEYE